MRDLGLALLLIVLGGVLPVACGGGGGGGGSGGATGFRVLDVDPRSGAGDLPNDTNVSVFLSDAVQSGSVDETTFYVVRVGDDTAHPGTREVSGNGQRLIFRPDPRFDTSTAYEVRVTAGIRSQTGSFLSTPFSSTFATNPWESPDRIRQSNFVETGSTLALGRSRHTSTTLPTAPAFPNEYVLVVGGYTTGGNVTARSELYDPDRDDFLESGTMAEERANHTATALDNGFVLVAGGEWLDPDGYPIAHLSSELYSVAGTNFVPGPDMKFARTVHTATLLPDGRVLITGGDVYDVDGWPTATATAEVYEPSPAPGRFVRVGDMQIPRSGHQATLLGDGKVLITGGSTSRTAELFNPATDSFRATDGRMVHDRWRHGAALLDSGRVLLAGGGAQEGEVYDPVTDDFHRTTGADSTERYAAVHLPYGNGQVLIIGGFAFVDSGILLHNGLEQFVENYGGYGSYFQIVALPPNGVYLRDSRAYSAASRLSDGRWLVTGGLGPAWEDPDVKRCLLFDPEAD